MIFQAQIPLSAEEKWEWGGRRVMLRQMNTWGSLVTCCCRQPSESKLNWSWKTKTGSPNFQLLNVI